MNAGTSNMNVAANQALAADFAGRFALLLDLGIITVPRGFDPFGGKNREKIHRFDDEINDKNFSNPTRVLKPGDKFRVRAFKQVIDDSRTSDERMAFLRSEKAVFTGVQGVILVWKQKRDQLPKGKWYTSFDEPDRLWKDESGYHRLPSIFFYSDGGYAFHPRKFGLNWNEDDIILCFCDVE